VRFYAPVQTGLGAHPASCTMGTRSLPGVKQPGRGVNHPPNLAVRLSRQVSFTTRKTSHHAPHTFHYTAASSIYSTTPHNPPYPPQQVLNRSYHPIQHTRHSNQSAHHYLLRTPYCPYNNPQLLLPYDILVGIQHLHNTSNVYVLFDTLCVLQAYVNRTGARKARVFNVLFISLILI
jgi:hypothetical protein